MGSGTYISGNSMSRFYDLSRYLVTEYLSPCWGLRSSASSLRASYWLRMTLQLPVTIEELLTLGSNVPWRQSLIPQRFLRDSLILGLPPCRAYLSVYYNTALCPGSTLCTARMVLSDSVTAEGSPVLGPSRFFSEQTPILGSPKTTILSFGEGNVISEAGPTGKLPYPQQRQTASPHIGPGQENTASFGAYDQAVSPGCPWLDKKTVSCHLNCRPSTRCRQTWESEKYPACCMRQFQRPPEVWSITTHGSSPNIP
jgi:hypothetical protein